MNLLLIFLLIFNPGQPLLHSRGSVPFTKAKTTIWPGFRGVGDSRTEAVNLPLEWTDEKNVAWKAALPGYGQSSPVVWRDKIFLTAVEGAMISKYRNNGQTCVCANRIYVQAGVYDAFAQKLADKVGQTHVGDGFDAGVTLGPLITPAAVAKVEEHIADATAKGAEIKMGGHRHSLGGTFFEPTILTGVTREMMVAHDETFGPVAPLFRFETEADVIEQANDTIFGLASYFYARDLSRVWRVAEALEYGMVGVNTGLISTEVAPFGGVKQSGLGREGSHHGIEDYLEMKYVCVAVEPAPS